MIEVDNPMLAELRMPIKFPRGKIECHIPEVIHLQIEMHAGMRAMMEIQILARVTMLRILEKIGV